MTHEDGSAEDERQWLAYAGEPERIAYVRAERWLIYPRAALILNQVQRLMDHPRNSRMPSLLIIDESSIGKSQLNLKFCRDHPACVVRAVIVLDQLDQPHASRIAPTANRRVRRLVLP
jgi:Bacterial TniB protein